jgi:hypothetical protein
MLKRLAVVSSIVAAGVLLDGCTECGPIRDGLDAIAEILQI